MSRLLKMLPWAYAVSVLFMQCDLEHNNPLDPDNPASRRNRIVLVEAFVNDGTGEPYVAAALEALENIKDQFKENVAIVEFHIFSAKWNDSLSTQESWARYNQYIKEKFGIPDIFINGGRWRIQGASSTENVFSRYRQTIEAALIEPARMTIEAKTSIAEDQLSITGKIARLGTERSTGVILRGFIIEDLGISGHRHVQRQILTPQTIGTLNAGDIKNFAFRTNRMRNLDLRHCSVILFAHNEITNDVYQAAQISF